MTTTDLTQTADRLAADLRRRGFTGQVVHAGEPGYDRARQVWDGTVDRRPALIAQPCGTSDVAAAIGLARDGELPLAIRGGGHSIAGHSACDDAIVIDLAQLRHVTVDPRARRARAGGGALLADLDQATQAHGLVVPAGQVSHTGVGGLTLGGGVGYLMRQFGLTIDSLTGAQVVTAAGEVVHASADVNPDLFWALRGGGGNFGVVTEFEFALHRAGPIINAGVFAYPYERAGEVLRASRAVMQAAPQELSIHEILLTVPEHEPFPAGLQGTRAVFLVPVHLGSEQQARADLAPLRDLGPVFDLVGPMPYLALQSMIDYDNRAGQGTYSRSHWLAGYDDELIDTLIDKFDRVSSPLSHLITARMGGAIQRVPHDATAFPHRSAANLLWIIGYWPDPHADGSPHRAWVDDVLKATRQYSTGGVYVNALADEGPSRIRSAYGQATYERLATVKARWDPGNLFKLNQNIPPSRSPSVNPATAA
jgi:FAD/FMN-containing dehydrogenase